MIGLRKKPQAALSCLFEDVRPKARETAEAIISGLYHFPSGLEKTGGYLPFGLGGASAHWQRDLHGFAWLRHFSAGDAELAALGRYYVKSWLEHTNAHRQAWQTSVAARRVISWLTNGRILTENVGDHVWQQQLRRALIHQGKFLLQRQRALNDSGQLPAAAALILLGLSVRGYDHWLERGFDMLTQEIAKQILPDGGHISRNPSEHLSVLFDLLTLKVNLDRQGRPGPDKLSSALDRMLPMLRFFRYGDGGLALFNGAREEESANLQAALAHDDTRGRPFAYAPHSGYQRLSVGRLLLLMDTGTPPPQRYAQSAHAGCLSLEMNSGKRRFIVNCGEARAQDAAWQQASRSTAAHSTLILQDTSSARRRRLFNLIGRGANMLSHTDSHRHEDKAGVWLDAGHDGYAHEFGLVHRRRLFISKTGREVRGEDVLEISPRHARQAGRALEHQAKHFTIRFHFHPDVRCGLSHGETKLLARLPHGEGWSFKAQAQTSAGSQPKNCRLQKQPSIYLGSDRPRRSEQLVLEGRTAQGSACGMVAKVNWVWQRTDRAA